MRAPCQNCTDRKLYCHDSCAKYLAYQSERNSMNADSLRKTDETDFHFKNILKAADRKRGKTTHTSSYEE